MSAPNKYLEILILELERTFPRAVSSPYGEKYIVCQEGINDFLFE